MKYIHPSTECDRDLIFADKGKGHPIKITPRDIKTELEAYWQHSDQIWQKLPITVDGETFTHWWQLSFEENTLPACRSGKVGKKFVEAYVYLSLRRLLKGLRERAGPQ